MTNIVTRLRNLLTDSEPPQRESKEAASVRRARGIIALRPDCDALLAHVDAWKDLDPLVGEIVARLEASERSDLYCAYHAMRLAALRLEAKP